MDTMDHHVEHKLVDVYDHIKSIVGKLEHKEEDSEERIALLETLVQKVSTLFDGSCVCGISSALYGGEEYYVV